MTGATNAITQDRDVREARQLATRFVYIFADHL
jgi:hypothetical protein